MRGDLRPSDLLEYLEEEKAQKLEYCKQLFRLCVLQREALESGDIAEVAEVIMQKRDLLKNLSQVEDRIERIAGSLTSLGEGSENDDPYDGLDHEIAAIMKEVMALEYENQASLARKAMEMRIFPREKRKRPRRVSVFNPLRSSRGIPIT
ncbi:MAG TPA: flagellar protein FlgN [Firmicutes bacterium]|nr:flagellar protein FlgN [Bacillota bacterium]